MNLEEIFSGEEYYGRFVDMHEVYEKFVNLPHVSRVDYVTYISSFYSFKDIPMETKKTPVSLLIAFQMISRLMLSIFQLF